MNLGANHSTCRALAIAICNRTGARFKWEQYHPTFQDMRINDAEEIIERLYKQGYSVVKIRSR